MSAHLWTGLRSFVTAGVLAVAAVVGFPSAAHASAAYRVWYFDDNFNTYNAGDVSDGWTKLVPPGWACGLVFDDPSYYRWVDGDGVTIDSDDFNKDVRVWIGKPGCSEGLSIEYADNSQSFPHVPGGSYMEITTDHGFSWIDDTGGHPSCGACVGPDDITYFPDDVDWAEIVVSAFKTVGVTLLDTRLRADAAAAIDRLGRQVDALYPALQAQVAMRRRAVLLGDLEAAVRPLEDAAVRFVSDASRLVATCSSQARLGKFSDAFAACTVSSDRLDAAGPLIRSAQYTFQHGDR
jgi:hypothetical protein